MALARSAELAPSCKRELTKRSIDTDGSPASILATRDWLDWSRSASWTCDRPCFFRRSRRLWLSASFISMRTASASYSPRNSLTDPTTQPAAFSLARLLFLMATPLLIDSVVFTQPELTGCDNRLWCLLCLFQKHIENDHRITICPVYDAK